MAKIISKARFDALSFSRSPQAQFFAQELEWFSDEQENVIATLIRDKIDGDYGFIILGRDELAMFRYIEGDVRYEHINEARALLKEKLNEYTLRKDIIFPQGDNKRKKNVIYEQIVSDNKLNPYFKTLMESEGFSPAKEIIGEIVYAFEDPDGNYIEQFQSSGFNSRIWELYLYALLHEEDFEIGRDYSAPDYLCHKFGRTDITICIEAVTVNPTEGGPEQLPTSTQDIQNKLKDYIPIKFGSPLYSKLRKRYWELDHVKGKPLVFAIEDFHQTGSLLWSGSALIDYLYGYRWSWKKDEKGNLLIIPEKIDKHKYGDKEIPSGFFFLPDAQYISAVLYSNSATISKFNRMGKLAGFGSPRVTMVREGMYHNHDPNASEPLLFRVEVSPETYTETWAEGLSMYHNPRALYPINPNLFPDIAHHYFYDKKIISETPEFHPYSSVTFIKINNLFVHSRSLYF